MLLRAFAAAVLTASPLAAQQRCEGWIVPDFGFDRLTLAAGSIHERMDDGVVTFRFTAEPTIGGVRAGGPAAVRLAEGDVLAAIDGEPITSRAGGARYGAVRRGERVTLTVRRDGRTREVAVVVGERCRARPAAAPRPPRPPRAAPPRPDRAAPPTPAPAPAPPRPPAPPSAPAPAPPAPPAFLPGGWFGFGIQCGDCGAHVVAGRPAEFRFRETPAVVSVEPGTPAASAGMRRGDRLTHVDGVALTTPEGWRRFGAIEPGERVRWTYTRGGRVHQATMTALRRPDARDAPTPSAAGADRLRYSGRVGDVRVEARGAPVTVTRDPATGETVIRSADLTVRVRPEG